MNSQCSQVLNVGQYISLFRYNVSMANIFSLAAKNSPTKMGELDRLFRILSTGEWFRTVDLAASLGWTEERGKSVCDLVSEYGLARYRKTDHSISLDPRLKNLMFEMDRIS